MNEVGKQGTQSPELTWTNEDAARRGKRSKIDDERSGKQGT